MKHIYFGIILLCFLMLLDFISERPARKCEQKGGEYVNGLCFKPGILLKGD